MNKEEFKKSLLSHYLSWRARFFGFFVILLFKSNMGRKLILNERQQFRTLSLSGNDLWIVTSVLRPTTSALSYSTTKSYFSSARRTKQTIASLESITIYANTKNYVLIDGSKETTNSNLDYTFEKFISIQNPILKAIINGPFKGLGEAILILIVDISNLSVENVSKLSARYQITKYQSPDPIIYKVLDGVAVTVYYSMKSQIFVQWQDELLRAIPTLCRGKSIEGVLFDFSSSRGFVSTDSLGVKGLNGITGGDFNA